MLFIQIGRSTAVLELHNLELEIQDTMSHSRFSLCRSSEISPIATFRIHKTGAISKLYQGENLVLSGNYSLQFLLEFASIQMLEIAGRQHPERTLIRADLIGNQHSIVVLAGGSFSGKSHLAGLLTTERYSWLGREVVTIDRQGQLIIDDNSAEENPSPPVVNVLAKLVYLSQSRTSLSSLSPGQATLELMPLVLGGSEAQARALPRLAKFCRNCQILVGGTRGNISSVRQAIDELPFAAYSG